MTATAKLHVYPALAGLGLIAALATRRPELVGLAAPFAVLVAAGLALARRPDLRFFVDTDRERQVEGRHIEVEVEVAATRGVERLELLLALPDGLVSEQPNLRMLRLIYVDCGTKDEWNLHHGARIFVRRLEALRIEHAYEEFDDGHMNIPYRYDVSLPRMARALA